MDLDYVRLWYAFSKGMKYDLLAENTCSTIREKFGLHLNLI